MIKIINTNKVVGYKNEYIVKVNGREIAAFYQNPSEGIGCRLLEASKAVERQELYKLTKLKNKYKLYLATGGWSGNEDTIYAILENTDLCSSELKYVQWNRGGKYHFEIEESK